VDFLCALQLLQVAAYLRRTGFFVVAALTRPFEFEGRRKLEEADALIEALQDVAQLVVSVMPFVRSCLKLRLCLPHFMYSTSLQGCSATCMRLANMGDVGECA
jgi:hypothetical protein